MNTKRKTKFVAFSSQKGGVGKTAFTAIAASQLHYRMGYNVAVLDCDFPQHSFAQLRERDMKAVMESDSLKMIAQRHFTRLNRKAYPVEKCRAEEALERAGDLISGAAEEIDVIFFDLPGTVATAGVLNTLSAMDYIFTPITADRVVLESTLAFTDVLTNVLMKRGQASIEGIWLFWNQVDGRERSSLYDLYGDAIEHLGLKLLKTRIMDTKRFRKESDQALKPIFRSTVLPPDTRLMKECGMDSLLGEIVRQIKLQR